MDSFSAFCSKTGIAGGNMIVELVVGGKILDGRAGMGTITKAWIIESVEHEFIPLLVDVDGAFQ